MIYFKSSMETSPLANSNSSQFPHVDMILLFHSFICYDSIKSFFSRYWSFSQSQYEHGCSKTSNWDQSNQKSGFSPSKEVSLAEKINKEDDGGRLSRKDVENLMGNLGLFCSHESDDDDDDDDEQQLNESYGSDEVSRLFEEEPSLEEVKQAFDVFDLNKDGFIDGEELQRVLCILGLKEGLKLENCNKMIKTFDENGDGRIDFQEFVKFMENSFC